jgi:hypothetical protein
LLTPPPETSPLVVAQRIAAHVPLQLLSARGRRL